MSRPSPALVVGGARCSLRAFRAPQSLRKASLTSLAGRGGYGVYEHHSRVSSVQKMLRKELRMVEQFPSSSRTFAHVLPSSVWEEFEDSEEIKDLRKAEYDQLLAARKAQEATGLEEYDRWKLYDCANPSSSKAVFSRRYPSTLRSLRGEELFYGQLAAYKKHFEPLLKAEQDDAKDKVVERLTQWSLERLVNEGYTLEDLSAFKYIKKGEKEHDGLTYSFVPPAGDSLGDNLFLRGSQVTIVSNSNSPLDYVNPDTKSIETNQGTVVYSRPDEIRIKLLESVSLASEKDRWRLDLCTSDIGRQRMLQAIEALNYNPADIEAISSRLVEYELHGTYLRSEILGDWCGEPFADTGPRDPTTKPPGGAQSLQEGLFMSNEGIRDWVTRHSLPVPEPKDGDPELLLNTSQVRAIAQMIGKKFSLVQGPPGTGKTRTIIETIRLLKVHFKVPYPLLICTYTNAAVDNLVEGLAAAGLRPLRIGSEGNVREDLSQWSLQTQMQNHPDWKELDDLKRQRHEIRQRQKKNGDSAADNARVSRLKGQIKRLEMSMQYHSLRSADVVCTTCLTAGSSPLRLVDFPAIFLDEASMSTEPASLIPLMHGSQHVALIGDHQQLPPVITSTKAQLGGLSRSLFQRLIEKKALPSVMLNTQYRMHPAISAFPSKEFYNAAIKNGTVSSEGAIGATFKPPESRHLSRRRSKVTGQVPSVLFIHHEHWEISKDRSRANVPEMCIVIAILEDLLLSNPEMRGENIGIIAPYVAQIKMLEVILKTDLAWEESFREKLGDKRALQMKEIEVKTVDGFQGREKEVIIFSTVRNNTYGQIGFLADRRRMNVALTRAKRALFVIGNMNTLSQGRYGDSRENPETNVARMMVQGSGDEWKKFIQFVLAEEIFTEYDQPIEYRSAEETMAFEHAAGVPVLRESLPLITI